MFITSKQITGRIPVKERIIETSKSTPEPIIEDSKPKKSYKMALAEEFLGLGGYWGMSKELQMHLTNHKMRRFIPFVFESALQDKQQYATISRPRKGGMRAVPALYFLEHATEGEIQRVIENNQYKVLNPINYGHYIRPNDMVSQICENDSVLYSSRTKKIYGFDPETFSCTTEGMSIPEFMHYCQEDYVQRTQEFFNSIPGLSERISDVKEQTSMLTGMYTRYVAETFNVPGFDKFISKVIKHTIIPDNYTVKLENVNDITLNVSHRLATKDMRGTFGKIYNIRNKYYVTPQTNKMGTKLLEVYLIAHNKDTKAIDYIPLGINSMAAMAINKECFVYKNKHKREPMLVIDESTGVPAIESVIKYFFTYDGSPLVKNDLDALDRCFEFYGYNDDGEVVTEDIVTGARDIAHKIRDNMGGEGIIGKGKRAAAAIIDPILEKIDDMKNKWDAYKEDESRKIVINGSLVHKVHRWFRDILGPALGIRVIVTLLKGAVWGKIVWIPSLLYFFFTRSDDEDTKRAILHDLEEELKIVREKIDDAKSDGDKQAKYKLMRLESKIEHEIAKIRTQGIN